MVDAARTFLVSALRFDILLFLLFAFQDRGDHPDGMVIPPPWANDTVNPCASNSWQLLYWPKDKNCYYIFQQGPCGETQEFYFDRYKGQASCRCSRGTSWHKDTQKCHEVYSQGPCGHKEYFADKELPEDENSTEVFHGECRKYKQCPPGHVFWPPSAMCFPHLSRGPCLHGHLLYVHPQTGTTECGCLGDVMSTNYWGHGASCHELFTRGPCVEGHLFIYNLTRETTECICGPHLLTNYHHQTGRCYELETTGPCGQGKVFAYDGVKSEAECSCLPGYVEWRPAGTCYRVFTRGPCPRGQFLTHDQQDAKEVGTCVKNSCSSGELYDPSTGECYAVGRRGPCPRGQLWVFERAASVRGLCHCDSHLIGYWDAHGICYELGERGPCPKRKVLSFDRKTGLLQCRCDFRRGFVPWANGRCIKAGVRRNKLVPVAGAAGAPIGSNAIQGGRVHRGLTLPRMVKEEEEAPERSSPPPRRPKQTAQEEILKDVLSTILQRNTSSNAVEQLPRRLRLRTETQTETAIHRITVSRSVTERRTQWQEAPVKEQQAGLRTRRVIEPIRKEKQQRSLRNIRKRRQGVRGGRSPRRRFVKRRRSERRER